MTGAAGTDHSPAARAAPTGAAIRESIVVGLTMSPASRTALGWAADHARRYNWVLRAVCVHPNHDRARPSRLTRADDVLDWSRQSRRSVDLRFTAIDPRPEWTLTQIMGRPGEDLVRLAASAGLLAIGRHNPSADLYRDSVAAYCLTHARVPVVVVPAPDSPVGTGERPDP